MLSSVLGTAQESKKIGLYTEIMYASRSIFHGWDIAADNQPVAHPYIEYQLGKTGLSAAWWGSIPLVDNYSTFNEYDFILKYGKTLFVEKVYQINFGGFSDFVLYPNDQMPTTEEAMGTKKLWKLNAGFSFSNLVRIAGEPIVPGYNLFYFVPHGNIDFQPGTVHELSLYYTIPILSRLKVGATTNYHTGAFGGGSGWTHTTAHLSTSVKVGPVNVAGSINYQKSHGARNDIADEFWVQLGVNKSF